VLAAALKMLDELDLDAESRSAVIDVLVNAMTEAS